MYNKEKYKLKSVVPVDFLSENIKKMSIEESTLYHINDIYILNLTLYIDS